jgi:hypothetical protein
LAGCANVQPNPSQPYIIPGGPGDTSFSRLGGADSGVIFRWPKQPEAWGSGLRVGVNPFLWRGALQTVGALPLISADPFGGVIITDWYSPTGAPDERFKESVFILGRDLRSDAVRVAVFRQVYRDGRWEDAPVNPTLQNDLQNRVVDSARALQASVRR